MPSISIHAQGWTLVLALLMSGSTLATVQCSSSSPSTPQPGARGGSDGEAGQSSHAGGSTDVGGGAVSLGGSASSAIGGAGSGGPGGGGGKGGAVEPGTAGSTSSSGGSGGTGASGGSGGNGNGGNGNGGTAGNGTSTGASGGSSGAGGSAGGGASACRSGITYPAPDLSATPAPVYKPTSAGSGTYEGPVWLARQGVLLLSDVTFTNPVNPSQMLRLAPPSTVTTFLEDAGTNGMAIDAKGDVFACSHKVQGIVKLDFDAASFTTVVDNYNGKKFNSPNDLTIRSDGTIYFTDPDFQLGSRTSETGKKGVYRVDPTHAVSVVDDTFNEPNGIALSPDESVLYVADYKANVVRSFSVASDGSVSARKDFASVSSPDGFALDCLGNLYVASGTPGIIQVYSPAGAKLGSVTVVSSVSNMAFGGTDGTTLYITAGKALYSLTMNLPGFAF